MDISSLAQHADLLLLALAPLFFICIFFSSDLDFKA